MARTKKSARSSAANKGTASDGIVDKKPQDVPRYPSSDFDRVVYKITYKEFLNALGASNLASGHSRKFAEDEWRKLVKSKWMVWGNDKPQQERNAEYHHALSQVDGFPGFDAEKYWSALSKPADVQPTEDGFHAGTGLKLPKYDEEFVDIGLKLGYKEFLRRLDNINGPVTDAANAEAAWKYFIQLKWYDWKTDLSPAAKDRFLADVLAQTKGHPGFYKDRIEVYWQAKKERVGNVKQQCSKDVVMEDGRHEKDKTELKKTTERKTKKAEPGKLSTNDSKVKKAKVKKTKAKTTKVEVSKIKTKGGKTK